MTLGRIVFLYILFISLAALLSGVLNASGRFIAAAAAPVLLNIILITTLILAEAGLGGSIIGDAIAARRHGTLLSFGVVLAGIAQLALVWVAVKRAGLRSSPRPPTLDAGVETPGHYRRTCRACGWRGAGQLADRTTGRQLL